MQIIIPMSGFGERFRRAGYKVPKPLIEIEGKAIIGHVIDMFPGNHKFLFVCNKDHLNDTDMESVIRKHTKDLEHHIIGIDPHKLGPVHAVTHAYKYLNPSEPTIVNYCDFTCYWSYQDFEEYVRSTSCDGAIPAYRGFHPHSLGSTNYAYIKTNKDKQLVEIKEKEPFTNDRMNEYASSGTYYFAKGEYVLKYFDMLIDKDINLNGEYYCSLVYNLMHEDNLKTNVYELEHFMQWGTPEDVKEYNHWSSIFREMHNRNMSSFNNESKKKYNSLAGTTMITMAGKGSRFAKEGYNTTKPLIEVNKLPMFIESVSSLPRTKDNIFIINSDVKETVERNLEKYFEEEYEVISLDGVTDGQSSTTRFGIEKIKNKNPITISACDHALFFDRNKLEEILNEETDIIAWVAKGYYSAVRNPEMYGWVSINEKDLITKTAVKSILNSPEEDYVITGTFTFRDAQLLEELIDLQRKKKRSVNGEYYLDSLIEEAILGGKKCKILRVSNYVCWGTPNELRTYNYWKKCFSKWSGHPYSTINQSDEEAV